MIDLERKTLRIGSKEHSIQKFEVWFRMPIGLCSDIDLAISVCQEMGVDPKLSIVAVPIAVVDANIYEELTR